MIFRLLTVGMIICICCIQARADEVNGTSASGTQAIPDNNMVGVTSTVTITGMQIAAGQKVIAADFCINLRHTWIGDLVVTVQKGMGPVATLFARVGRMGMGNGFSSNLGRLDGQNVTQTGEYQFKDGGTDLWGEAAIGGTDYFSRSVEIAGDPNPYRAVNADSSANVVSLNTIFQNVDPIGAWTFTVTDLNGTVVGFLGETSVHLVTVPEPGTVAGIVMLSMFGGVYFRRRHLAKKKLTTPSPV